MFIKWRVSVFGVRSSYHEWYSCEEEAFERAVELGRNATVSEIDADNREHGVWKQKRFS